MAAAAMLATAAGLTQALGATDGQALPLVAGRVVSRDSSPIEAVVVELSGSNGTSRTITDSQGHFRFVGLQRGYYELRAQKPPYAPVVFGARHPADAGVRIAVSNEQGPSDLTITLPDGAVIAGVVRNHAGVPLGRLRVVPLRVGSGQRGVLEHLPVEAPTGWEPGYAVRTALDGTFRIHSLPEGQYVLRLRVDDRWIYYPGVADPMAAAKIDAAPGATEDVTIIVPELPSHLTPVSVTGHVIGGAAGLERVHIIAQRISHPRGAPVRSLSTTVGAEFEWRRVAPGKYVVDALATPVDLSEHRTHYWARSTVDIASGRPAEMTFVLRPGMNVSGRVRLLEGGSPDDFRVELRRLDRPDEPPAGADVATDGTFVVRGRAPGTYRVTVAQVSDSTPLPVVLTAFQGGGISVDILEVPEDRALDNVIVTVTSLRQTLSGYLKDRDGQPATGLTLLVFPSNPELRAPPLQRVRAVRPATDGFYAVPDLPAGEYFVAALRDPDYDALASADFLSALDDASVAVSLAPGETRRLDLVTATAEGNGLTSSSRRFGRYTASVRSSSDVNARPTSGWDPSRILWKFPGWCHHLLNG